MPRRNKEQGQKKEYSNPRVYKSFKNPGKVTSTEEIASYLSGDKLKLQAYIDLENILKIHFNDSMVTAEKCVLRARVVRQLYFI